MRQWTSLAASVAFGLACLAGPSRAAEEAKLKNLVAPPPAPVTPLTGDVRQVKFSRLLIQLKPEPWAFLRNKDTLADDKLLTWQEGEKAINPQAYAAVFEDELKAAGGRGASSGGLFVQEAQAPDLLVAVKITDMQGRLCKSCGLILASGRWEGAVVMTAHWEVFSVLERQVVAAGDITGGYNAPGRGVDGEPEQFIIQAFRDNVRRFIATDSFRKAVSTPAAPVVAYTAVTGPIALTASKPKPGVAQASASVAVVFTESGSGSGFLISDEGYLLTNHHVVGASRVVKLKWADGGETTGQVIRSDPARDVALIRTNPGTRPALGLRHTPVQQGETVFAIGSPLGDRFQNTMSKGIVSALRNQQGLTYIQSDVMVNHGSSGGPLIDDTGQVIGLTASGQMQNGAPVGINFFIPIDDALKTLSLTAPPATLGQVAAHQP